MTEHPIAPPPELVDLVSSGAEAAIATKILQWAAPILRQQGADQELEACIEWIAGRDWWTWDTDQLRATRRPNPPSLKEQALQALSEAVEMADDVLPEGICSDQADIIRRALEQLDD